MTRCAVLVLTALFLTGLAAGLPLHAHADELPKIPVKVNADKLY